MLILLYYLTHLEQRIICKACRYQLCITAGMKPECRAEFNVIPLKDVFRCTKAQKHEEVYK